MDFLLQGVYALLALILGICFPLITCLAIGGLLWLLGKLFSTELI